MAVAVSCTPRGSEPPPLEADPVVLNAPNTVESAVNVGGLGVVSAPPTNMPAASMWVPVVFRKACERCEGVSASNADVVFLLMVFLQID